MPNEPRPPASLLARLDPSLLRRAAAALVSRPRDYGDLFVEDIRHVEIRREGLRPGEAIVGGGAGAAARVLGTEGVRHVAVAGRGSRTVEAMPAILRGDPGPRGAARGPADMGEQGAWADAPPVLDPATVESLAAYLDAMHAGVAAIGVDAPAPPGGTSRRGPAAPMVRARAETRVQQVVIATSEGEVVEDRREWTAFTIRLSVPWTGGRVLTAAAGAGARDVARLAALHPPERVVEGLLREIEESRNAAPAPTGEVQVVLGPGTGGLLFHEACGHALEGDRALRGRSALADLLGERVGPASLTLVDDPTIDGLPGTRRRDDEGWPSAPTVLIDAGRVAGLLLDRMTALRAGTSPTGSARRESYRDLPLPRMTNTFVREGSYAPGEILAAVPRGLYVAELGPGRVDTASADFMFNVRRGYIIAGGRMVAPSGPCIVVGNGVRALAGVRMIGSDLRFDPGAGECGKDGQRARAAVGQPTLLIDGLSVRPGGA